MSDFCGDVVALHTPLSSLVIARRWPMPVTATSLASGARRRNVMAPSAPTSGERTAGPRPGCDIAGRVSRTETMRGFIEGRERAGDKRRSPAQLRLELETDHQL